MDNPNAEKINPCLKEQKLSYKCLDDNGYDATKCQLHFDNYNICKKFWGQIYNDRRARRQFPYLPEVKDRDRIKEEYLSRQKNC